VVSVDAIPDAGWKLDHWLLDAVDVGDADPYSVTIDNDHALTAVFVEDQRHANSRQSSGHRNPVSSDSSGNIPPTAVWSGPLTLGKYDVVVDVNGNGVYDEVVDALDDNDVEVTAGFFVIPEFLFGTILGLLGCFAAFGVFRVSKRKRW
jgi:hypothetical protein